MTFYHATLKGDYQPGDEVELGHPSNFSPVPLAWVFCADNWPAVEFWSEFLGGDTMREKLGYWPDVHVYEVEPTGHLEPDPWSEANNIPGCWQSKAPLTIIRLQETFRGE